MNLRVTGPIVKVNDDSSLALHFMPAVIVRPDMSPNFGDYTDNASTGTRTYDTWTDGRLGVPQPFVDRR